MSLTTRRRAIGVCVAMTVGVGAGSAGELVGTKSPGTWFKGSFAQINVGCMQSWVCAAPGVLHGADTKLVTTPNEGAAGICNAAGGNIEGCNACASSPPKTACQYWLEKK